jgi:hypothetical protein
MIATKSTRAFLSNPAASDDADSDRIDPASPVWHGFLDEFRNNLSVLAAATDGLREDVSPGLVEEIGDAVFDTERKVRGLTALASLADASAGSIEPILAPLGLIVDRAVRLAAPASGGRASIVVSIPRALGVKNRGAALEGLLAALMMDLAAGHAPADARAAGELERPPLVRVDADAGRRGLTIEVSCSGARLDASARSWRFTLASELAARLGATLTVEPEAFAYVVQFGLTSS